MKTGKVIVALVALSITSALAQSTEYSDADAHVGETATVTGKVVRATSP